MASFVVDNGDSIFGGNAIISNALTVYDNIMIGGQFLYWMHVHYHS